MNSRSVSDNLVNFSTDLTTTLNQLDSKEPLLSFPFDHLYACSDNGDRRQTLHLKEVEISTHCVVPHQENHVTQRLASLEIQNKKLKDLLIYHLDLIQQQNDLMSKKEKAFQALRLENDTLRSKVTRAGVERKVTLGHHGLIPTSSHVPVTATVTSTFKTDVPSSTSQQNFYNSINELLLSQEHTTGSNSNPYLYNPSNATKSLDPFGLDRPTDTVTDLHNFLSSELGVPAILDVTSLANEVPATTYTMIDNKRPRRETKPVEANNEPKYTVTTNSGHPKISRNQKRPTGIGSFSRMPKTKAAPKSTMFDNDIFGINKQSKTACGKTKITKYGYTALQERMKLIEPTPTGEDPYQIGEAEMREQSPIPKLMLQKTNHGRMRICSESGGSVTSTITSTTPTRRIYDTMNSITSSSKSKRAKLQNEDPYSTSNITLVKSKKEPSASIDDEQELDVEKIDNETDWGLFPTNKPKERSLCDFSYGETSANLVNIPLDITKMEFPDLFDQSPVNADSSNLTVMDTALDQPVVEKTKKRRARTTSLAGPIVEDANVETKRPAETKRGRKRALSTAIPAKRTDTQQKVQAKPRTRRATRAKKSPVPGLTTNKPYHTCMGDPDLSWYLGLDPDIKKEDCDPTETTSSNVEVPRWREKVYTPLYSMEGTENLDDKVFEKRHQKYEAEERRQLRWHMRRIREQRHVERLRQRQRDPWGPGPQQAQQRGEYTVWPQPVRDLQYIEITDELPVIAFGEDVPELPVQNFTIPWVRTPRALKRTKKSKTLH